jgi:CarboxypepD_reg-like domain/TonB-dependent Receptor Plug Domain
MKNYTTSLMNTLLKTFIRLLAQSISFLFLLFVCTITHAQQLTQTIRGTVIDKVSQSPMQGAVVQLLNVQPAKGTAADANGKFVLTGIPVGRQALKVTYIGYKEYTLPNITVNSGKEVVLTIQLEENIVAAKEVVITAKVEKNKPLNEMSTVSTRTFSVEETQKFAAAVNDPARMATSFAGVIAGNDGNNTISIRGNSPNGLLWRMEGVDIPNPNHFANVGTSGGGISILSAQLLSNSDFMTGAFASEYGNALSGVFDLKLRKGNNEKREHTFQVGVLGVDVASEGPIAKGYEGSYLVNYRYSTLSLLGAMGLNVVGDATTDFQDLAFNVSLPTSKMGTFGVFGFGGLSSQVSPGKNDSALWKEETYKQYPSTFHSYTGTFGINNLKRIGNKCYIKTSLVFSGTDNGYDEKEIDRNYITQQNYNQAYTQSRLALSSTFTHKIDAKNSFRSGFILSGLHYNFFQRYLDDSTQQMKTFLETSGNTATVQAFGQWNHKLNARFTTNIGLHTLFLSLNNTSSIEPRASIKYDISAKQNIAFGYGLHGQIQPMGAYFAKDANNVFVNKKLGMTQAHHFVLSHDINLNPYTHIKTEVYYQSLFNVPVSKDPTSTFSMLNAVEGFNTDPLINNGLGRNYGLELTLERFLHRNFYYLLSMSLYESKYRAPNNEWYNTRFNTNYATTLTAGKEWELSEKRKRKVLGLSTKLVYVGGFRQTPIDLAKSAAAGEQKDDESKPYTLQNPDYFRIDIKLSLKRNFAHSTTTLSLDLQNATNRENIGGQYYNKNTGKIQYFYQAGLIPVLAYKIEF